MPKRIDNTQPEIVDALRKAGYSVLHLHTIGHGCPDLLVSTLGGRNVLVECKSPGGKLTPDESRFWQSWGGRIIIATSAEDALKQLEAW